MERHLPPVSRPDPDDLLQRVQQETRRQARGRLKVFFGAAPGVGKTYAMLQAARLRARSATDVAIGIVETHGRPETGALLEGMQAIPRRTVIHKGITLEEFDLDAALARRPSLLLVDELAHTNAPGSRHVKRWQDVIELIDAGIDVYTTLNVQHLESLNDVVAQITGIVVRETLPDSVLDQADEIELVDLPVEELRKRLEAGKVYFPDQAQRAMDGFFRPGNLIALRELALRRTAERVDAQMRLYRRDHLIHSAWPVTERLIVSVGPSPFSAKLIRAAKRMSERLHADWIAVYVETPEQAAANEEVRLRVASALRLAAQLGAETATLTGADVSESLLAFARSRNVSRIILGKHPGPLWRRIWRGSVFDELVASSGDMEIIAISGGPEAPPSAPLDAGTRRRIDWRGVASATAAIGAASVIALVLRPSLAPVNLVMVYLLAVVAIAMRSSRGVALYASVLSVAAFDFFCVPPYLTFAVHDYEYVVTFSVMLTVAVVIASLTIRVRLQAIHAAEREARTQALYRLSRTLGGETRWMELGRSAAAIMREVFETKVILFFPEEDGRISFRRRTSDDLPLPKSEEGIAQWVLDHGQKAGAGMDTLPGASALYVPLKGSQSTLGVIALLPSEPDRLADPEQQHLLDLIASQTALALERIQASTAAREAQLQAEAEQTRSSLLSTVSHDLRTPLAAITGAASTLRSQRSLLDETTQNSLIESIEIEADRLGRLVSNLLEMTRLDAGAGLVNREWHPLEELAGTALIRLERVLAGREITTNIPAGLMISGDGLLLEQVLWNLMENAIRHTPPATSISLSAREWPEGGNHGCVEIDVRDFGPGFTPGEENAVWEKFYRGKAISPAATSRGAGLGLPICRAIVASHGGTIEASNHPGGGALIRIRIPHPEPPPEAPLG
jgi:two-component system, OmpR family, sensor histidine kinase KdpD